MVCKQLREPTKEEPFNFDVKNKKDAPLPSCRWDYQYDIAKSVLSGLCFAMGAFILILGKKYIVILSLFLFVHLLFFFSNF